jgi:hypothetical protein
MTNFEKFLIASEEVITSHEIVDELLESIFNDERAKLDALENTLIEDSDFESIRTTIEEMQTFVCENFKDSDEFITNEKFVELSIELYQNAKYSIEALEENESITTNFAIVMFFNSIFDNIDTIRKLTR